MKVEILEQKKNPLLKREEVSVSLEHPGKATPSRKEILPELAKALKSREDLLIIDKIFSVPGKNISEARVLAYKKKDEIPKNKLEKMKGRMAPRKKAAAPAPEAPKEGEKPPEGAKEEAAPAEEKPAEEKKEAPAEEKKGEAPEEEAKPEEKPPEEKKEAEKPAEEKQEEGEKPKKEKGE